MQPERRRESSEQTGIARARMYLKSDIDWLEGFPVDQGEGFVGWQPRPKLGEALPARIRVDRERLTRTQLTLTKLVNRFPRAMPKIVGDVEAWRERVTSVLDLLKGAVHDGADLLNMLPRFADSQSSTLLLTSVLRLIATAVIWFEATNKSKESTLLTWIAANSKCLEQHLAIAGYGEGLINTLLMGELIHEDGAEDWQWGLSILGDSRCFTIPMHGFDQHVCGLIHWLSNWRNTNSQPAFPERPAATFGSQIVEFIRQIATERRVTRRRAARLASLVLDARLLASWTFAWTKLDRDCSAAIRQLQGQAQYMTQWDFGFQKQTLSDALKELRELKTEPVSVSDILSNIWCVCRQASERLASSISDALAAVPNNSDTAQGDAGVDLRSWGLRVATLAEFSRYTQRHFRDNESQAQRYLQLFAGFLRKHRNEPWVFAPWQSSIKNRSTAKHYWNTLMSALQCELPDTKRWPVVFEILGRLAAHPQYDDEHHDELVELYSTTSDIEVTCRQYLEVQNAGKLVGLGVSTLASASALEPEPNSIASLCEILNAIDTNDWQASSRIVSLHHTFRAAGWTTLIPQMLIRGEVSLVTTTASRLALLRDLKQTQSPTDKPMNPPLPDWAALLPNSLHSAASFLAAVSPNARDQADGILERNFPNRDKLDREIAAIEQRLSSAPNREHLEIRLSNLRQRRDSPKPVAAETIETLNKKLSEVTTRVVLTSFRQSIEAELASQFCARAGFHQIAEQLSTPRYLELVAGIVKLPEPFREFGLRLLRRRWGNQTWDSVAEPENQRFIERLRDRGLNVEPWLKPSVSVVVANQADRQITIAFEEDDIERLLMGYYFDTCLSPRGFNFFSAITNAVDINKRVLFARDETHNVVGRCLLVIGNAGTILTFNPYCNDAHFPFGQHVAVIAAQLAREMGTVVSNVDHVSPLLTPRWYDDGACDLGLSVSSEGSALRTALQTATDDNLLSLLDVALTPQGLTETTLAMTLEMPEMSQRPSLIKSLLPRLEQYESNLTSTTRMLAASHAQHANFHDFAARRISRDGPEWLIRHYREHHGFHDLAETIIKGLIYYHPSAALRVLRQTRHKSVRDDESETDPFRRKLLATAHRALGREKLADSLGFAPPSASDSAIS